MSIKIRRIRKPFKQHSCLGVICFVLFTAANLSALTYFVYVYNNPTPTIQEHSVLATPSIYDLTNIPYFTPSLLVMNNTNVNKNRVFPVNELYKVNYTDLQAITASEFTLPDGVDMLVDNCNGCFCKIQTFLAYALDTVHYLITTETNGTCDYKQLRHLYKYKGFKIDLIVGGTKNTSTILWKR